MKAQSKSDFGRMEKVPEGKLIEPYSVAKQYGFSGMSRGTWGRACVKHRDVMLPCLAREADKSRWSKVPGGCGE